jgi:hypothetical protein
VGAPSLTAAKPRLERRRQFAGVETGRGGTKLHAIVAGSRVTAFLATAAPWEPYFTDNHRIIVPLCVSLHFFTTYSPVISLPLNLVSGVRMAVIRHGLSGD